MFFMRIEMLSFLFLFACMRFVLFVRMKSSCKRKIKRFKITLIPSFTILLTCTPLNLPMKNLFVRTYFCLWESFFFMISCKTFFINLLQYFTTASKNKLKILKAITFTYFLSVFTYSHLLFVIQSLFSFVCIYQSKWSLRIENLLQHK